MESIRKMRALSGISQQKLANLLGTSKAYISQLESEKVHDVPLVHAKKMAKLFNCSVLEIYGLDILKTQPENSDEAFILLQEILDVYFDFLERGDVIDRLKNKYLC